MENNVLNIAAEPTEQQSEQLKSLNDSMVINSNQVLDAQKYLEYLNSIRTKTLRREYKKVHRNDPCPCGSGKKYKHCCLESGKYENLVE